MTSERAAASCRALFGTDDEILSNRHYREQRLVRLRPSSRRYFNLTHRSRRWKTPRRASIRGVIWRDVVQTRDGGYDATVEVQPTLARSVGCRPGLYRVSTDDSLSASMRLLAVRPEFLLLDKDGRLFYLERKQPVRFRMVWQSPWELLYKPSKSSAPTRNPPKRRR